MPFYILLILFVHCALPARKENMVVQDVSISTKIDSPVSIESVEGGSLSIPFWNSNISSYQFKEALHQSISKSQIFSEVSLEPSAMYSIKACLTKIDRSTQGSEDKHLVIVGYTVFLREKIFYEKFISTEGSAPSEESLFPNLRARMAIENAAQKNIQIFLEDFEEFYINQSTPYKLQN